MAKNAEIKVKISADGGASAASEINKVEKAAGNAATGGLSKLTNSVEKDLKGALSRTLPGSAGDAAAGLSGIAGPALGAGAAIAGLALKGVSDFEHLGVSVDNFATATGSTLEAASRWTEVAGDLGVGADTVETAMGKMNKTLGKTPDAFTQYGVAVVHAKDGTVDANATFLNAIDTLGAIQDPTLQAAAGAAIFGKGWQGMAQLISTGAPQLRKDLASVQPEKIFGAKDVEAAKGVRDGFAAIKDAGEALMLTIGRRLAPVVAELAPKIAKVVEAAGPAIAALGEGLANAVEASLPLVQGLATALDKLAPALKVVGALAAPLPAVDTKTLDSWVTLKQRMDAAGGSAKDWAFATDHGKASMEDATTAVEQFEAAQQKQADTLIRTQEDSKLAVSDHAGSQQALASAAIHADDAIAQLNIDTKHGADVLERDMASAARHADEAIAGLKQGFDELRGAVSDDQAFLNLAATFDDVRQKAADAFQAGASNAADAEQKARDYKLSVDGLKQSIIDVAQNVAGISPQETKKLLMEVDSGQLDLVEQQIARIKANAAINVSIVAKGGAGYGPNGAPRASGGPVTAGVQYTVGERGREQFVPSTDGTILPNNALGGHTYVTVNATINMPVGSSGEDVIRAIKTYERRNSTGWRS